MKRIIPIFLFICLILPAIVGSIVLRHEKKAVRRSVKHRMMVGMDADQLVTLKFKNSEINDLVKWKHAKEFEYNGNMFDIVDLYSENDTTYYNCWPDNEETILNKKLAKISLDLFNHSPTKKHTDSTISNLYKSLFFQINRSYQLEIDLAFITDNYWYSNTYHSNDNCPPEQPPPDLNNLI